MRAGRPGSSITHVDRNTSLSSREENRDRLSSRDEILNPRPNPAFDIKSRNPPSLVQGVGGSSSAVVTPLSGSYTSVSRGSVGIVRLGIAFPAVWALMLCRGMPPTRHLKGSPWQKCCVVRYGHAHLPLSNSGYIIFSTMWSCPGSRRCVLRHPLCERLSRPSPTRDRAREPSPQTPWCRAESLSSQSERA